ncbi:MAG TPA: hypothetical protein VNJ08_04330 [Bacteriovoracaceae bacterium]|nr:hypothetical protein [Bacteriovoracaceae bacterium]
MKSFILALVLVVMSFSAAAQIRVRIPIPSVNVGFRCSVLMIDNWHRVLRSYTGRADIISGRCTQPMRQCRQSLPRWNRMGYRCVNRNGNDW